MADAPASLEAIQRVASALENAGVRYAFIGGAALSAWGVPRATFDLDLALSIPEEGLGVVLDALSRRGFVIDAAFRKGFRDRVGGMETIHVHLPAGSTLMAVDLFLATTPLLGSVVERRTSIDLGRGPIQVCTAADLILLKLIADRPKDRIDVENVLAVQGVPERDYLVRWAERLGLRGRLEEILKGRS
jgi:hypothetical protein